MMLMRYIFFQNLLHVSHHSGDEGEALGDTEAVCGGCLVLDLRALCNYRSPPVLHTEAGTRRRLQL